MTENKSTPKKRGRLGREATGKNQVSCAARFWHFTLGAAFVWLNGCSSSEIKPVDIYPEDMCSQCRMAVSELAFASEIITTTGEVYKFDDLGCLQKFQTNSHDFKIAATFVKEFESKKWLPYERSTIVRTGINTPMGSGLVAFADSARAKAHLEKFPVRE